MKKLTTYLLAILTVVCAAAGLNACTKDLHDFSTSLPDNVSFNDDGSMNISISVAFPDMAAPTRALNENPNYGDLQLILLVFEDGTGLRQRERILPDDMDQEPDLNHNGRTLVKFNVKLEPTEKNAVIHLIATNEADLYDRVDFGPEERVLTALYTSKGNEAYWQRIDLGDNIPCKREDEHFKEGDEEKVEKISAALTHVPMIRNFCRVSVTQKEDVRFELKGIYVINTVDRGSVAPYVAKDDKFVEYCDPDNTGKSYREISEQGHTGTIPPGITLENKDTTDPANIASKSEGTGGNVAPVYFYERPARENSTERTYVILKGRYNGSGNAGKDTFYKIDLGYTDGSEEGLGAVGRFVYYNLLRNFDYRINLNNVASDGYGTFAEAAKGAVYNNFSASVEARNMTSISDGDDMIFVSFTSYVFTEENQTVKLKAQFRENINQNNGGTVKNELLKFVWDSGDVAEIIKVEDEGTGLNAWKVYTIQGKIPTEALRQQDLYIYRGAKDDGTYGLYRVITFFAQEPWRFKNIDTFPGLWEDVNDMPPWDWSNDKREIGQFAGAPLTLFFELPAGLPQALFPLEFVIESDRQNIQNAYQGNAVVRSVSASESLFNVDPTIGTPSSTRIQYVKTVRWEDYNGELSDELVGTGSSIVRCRFLTITDLTQDGIGGTGSNGSSTTTLRVYNPYFGQKIVSQDGTVTWKRYHEDGFTRNTKTSDPTPSIWNFSTFSWASVISELGGGNAAGYTASVDNLDISASAASTLYSGSITIDENEGVDDAEESLVTYSYLRTTSANVTFTHTRDYPGEDNRTVRIYVMSTDDNGNPVAPAVKLTQNGGTTALELAHTVDNTTKPFASQVYESKELDMKTITSLELTVKAPDNTEMRFYRIEFHPRWGEFQQSTE